MLNRVIIGVVAVILLVFGIIWLSGKQPVVRLSQPVSAIGQDTPVSIEAQDPHGIKSVMAFVEQDGQRKNIFTNRQKTSPSGQKDSWGFTFPAGKKEASFLKEGAAKLIVEVKSNDMRGATATLSQDVQVVLKPPTVVPDGLQHYINQGELNW